MISKRYRRSAQPQENLKQFSLNSSRGVDETKPVTDPSTVLDMQNLTVNDDGSLSIRKRMLAAYSVPTSGGEKVHLMHTGEHVLVCDTAHGVRIFPKGSATKCTYNVKGTTYYSRVEVTANATIDDFSSQWDVSAATFLNTSDSTILGNVYVSDNLLNTIGIDTYPTETLIDLNLLPSASARPRYLKITETDTENVFDILIVTPETNTLTTSEDSVSLNPNMTLDNPYAIRDVYGSELVQVTGIIPYVDVDSSASFFSKSDRLTQKYFDKSFIGDLDPDNPEWYSPIVDNVVEDLYFADVSSNFGNFYSFVIDPSIVVTLRVYLKGTLAYLQYKASAPVPDGVLGTDLAISLKIGLADTYEELNSVYNFRVFPTYTANGKPIPVSLNTIHVPLDLSRGSGEVVLKFDNTGSAPTNLKEALKIYADNFELSESARASLRLCVVGVYAHVTTYPIYTNYTTDIKVSAVTENGKPDGYRGVTVLDPTYASKTLLKAFCKLPKSSEYYCKWEYSLDGINWNVYGDLPTPTDSLTLAVPSDVNPSICSEVHVVSKLTRKNEITGTPIPPSPMDLIDYRPDVLPLQAVIETVGDAANASDMLYRFKIFSIDGMTPVAPYDIRIQVVNNSAQLIINNRVISNVHVDADDTATVDENGYVVINGTATDENVGYLKRKGVQGKIGTIVASFETRIPTGSNMEYLETDMPNAVLGEKLYYKKAMYSYGTSVYDTFAYASDAGSFITPLYNILELDANAQDTVCAIVPWRNYLITCTEKSVYLSSKSENGFYTKTISTSVGIPFADRYCVKAALNGLILKSGYSIYFAYPNVYASDDTTLSLTDISKPISHILDEALDSTYECFAEVVNDLYVLMIPKQDSTACLCYNLNTRLWEYYTYPVSFSKFIKDPSIGTVVVSTRSGMVYSIFDSDYARIDPSKNNLLPERYGDVINFNTVTSLEDSVTSYIATPIAYCWDTGQKTDSIAHTKQFVESKLVFATLSDRDAFPFTMYVAIDGDPHVTVQDVSTDAPFWKPADPGVGVAGTGFKLSYNDESPIHSNFNVLRQYVVRYSGKGKSIRHRIEGESLCNFKLYETYARYKNLNIKQ